MSRLLALLVLTSCASPVTLPPLTAADRAQLVRHLEATLPLARPPAELPAPAFCPQTPPAVPAPARFYDTGTGWEAAFCVDRFAACEREVVVTLLDSGDVRVEERRWTVHVIPYTTGTLCPGQPLIHRTAGTTEPASWRNRRAVAVAVERLKTGRARP